MDFKYVAWLSLVLGVIIFGLGVGAVFEDIVYYFRYKVWHFHDIFRVTIISSVGILISVWAYIIMYVV